MQSPVTGEPMVVLELHGVEVDYCPTSGGVWLDAGELEVLLGGHEAWERLRRAGDPILATKERPRRCPVSGRRMQKAVTGGKTPVIYDFSDYGIWLDKGELHQILVQGSPTPEGQRIVETLRDMFPDQAPE